ncbi:aminopeptidase P family protein [Microbacterium indicum]|uniref:aminopeptidase P family protein n=1 Tax=Microbacterium indicum TaxID=358100 RepID=UPI0003F9E6D5|nr:aminopeptidase P family protein [Microbacterium indicum]
MTTSDDTTTAEKPRTDSNTNRRQPYPQGFLDTISTGWADREDAIPAAREQAPFAAARRDAVSAAFPGRRLVVPAGGYQVRSNDTDFPFRAHSAFAHLTGWASDAVADSLLVFDPTADGHDVTLFLRDRATRETAEFYRDASIGEFWVGPRPSLAAVAADLGVETADLSAFASGDDDLVVGEDEALTTFVSELRLIKDAYEVAQLQLAVDTTKSGFDDIVAELPRVIEHPRGERVVEGVFHSRARSDGNWEGYDTIAAAGAHACYLHWTRNDGAVAPGDLILIDAGVEVDSLYTADVTRTLPVDGTFSPVQRRIYEAVLEAADAVFSAAKPGIRFQELHDTAMRVIAEKTAEWGILPVPAAEALDPKTGGQQRRYMVHGTSHHLGLDVHDCAQARREMYYEAELRPGMVFTIEPGLYFQADDMTVPEEFRGIGVRIEDDILMTEDGPVNLSAAVPRTADDVEAWVRGGQSR